jgi:hypothetical protein
MKTGPGANPASCILGAAAMFSRGSGRGVLLTTQCHLAPRLRMSRSVPLLRLPEETFTFTYVLLSLMLFIFSWKARWMPFHALHTTYPRNLASRRAAAWCCSQTERALLPVFVSLSLFSSSTFERVDWCFEYLIMILIKSICHLMVWFCSDFVAWNNRTSDRYQCLHSLVLNIYVVLVFETNGLLSTHLWKMACWLNIWVLLRDAVVDTVVPESLPVSLNEPVPGRGRCTV